MSNIDVVLQGKGPVTLRDSNYVATGGEGTVYKVSDMVVKIYHEPEIARQRGMPDKINILSKMKHKYVSSPLGLVTKPKGESIGHYLPYVDGHPLSRVFTNDFWQREGFEFKHASTLVDRMREVYSFAHQNKAVLVDANELNWFTLFSGSNPEPRVIDVDSWSLGRWPATVIMPSIRDWHSKTFDEKSDWFAFAVVTFQIYTGIHPYKGTLDNFGRGDLLGRMKANASVFSQGVRLNKAVRDFGNIPAPLLSWYEAVFQNGERNIPPSPFDTSVTTPRVANVMHVVTTGKSGLLVYDKLLGLTGEKVVKTFHCGVALLSSGRLIDVFTKRQVAENFSRSCEVVKVDSGWFIADISKGEIHLTYVESGSHTREEISFSTNGRKLVSYENRLFVVTEKGLSEIKFTMLGKPLASVGQTWGALINSTKWFSGVGVMDAMGAMYVITPFGEKSAVQVRIKELDGLRILAGKSGNRFVSLLGINKQGEYKRIDLVFTKDYGVETLTQTDVDNPELNLAILPKGVCARIEKDGELDIFAPTANKLTRIEDKQLSTDMELSNWDDRVTYIQNGQLWSLRMK